MALKFAVVTLLTTDSYLPGALTAIHSLLDVEGAAPFRPFETVCIITPSTVGHESLQAVEKVFDHVIGVEEIMTQSWTELDLLGRKDLAASLTKLHLFRLSQYQKVIFIDADTLILRPISPLFDSPSPFSAAPDSGWPDAFNSGFMVATPSEATFDALMDMMAQRGSWDGGDQGLLNDFFPDWNRLSFTYNVTPSAYYTYAPAYRRHGTDVSVLHFIGRQKPWNRGTRLSVTLNSAEDLSQTGYNSLLNKWFDVFERHFGTGITFDVASRVVVPPTFTKKPASLVNLPSRKSPSPPTAVAPLPMPISTTAATALWDPARSSPPRDQLQMREPINDHYENIWDDPSRRKQRVRFSEPVSYAPPPPSTHDWYRAVMSKAPDPSKVKAVFPWEESPEEKKEATNSKRASRSFPQAEPLLMTAPPSAAPTYSPTLATPVFSNAWDSIPGIERYATNLAVRTGSSSQKPTAAGRPGDVMGGRASSLTEPDKNFDRRSDASSRDGDDEEDSETNSSDETDRHQIRFKSRDVAATYGAAGSDSPTRAEGRSRSVSGSGSGSGSGSSDRLQSDSGDATTPTFTMSPSTSGPPSPTKTRRDVRHAHGATSPRLGHHTHHSHHTPTIPTPSVRGAPADSPRLAAQAMRNSTAARLISTGNGVGDGPPVVRATRVFSPETDTGVIKKQGLASLQRFVENMEHGQPPMGSGGPGTSGTWRF
ncbi:hypothetical protein P7C70_g1082, partial [Phenoliferia sp. Uapishka_3]